MSNTNPPRFLPTLTEVVSPEFANATLPVTAPSSFAPAASVSVDDTARITQNVLARLTPMLEQQLRSSAHELFEVQVNVVLPALHRHVEAAVRQAIEETLAERGDYAGN